MKKTGFTLLILALVILSGCGGQDAESEPTSSPTPTPTVAPTPTPTPSPIPFETVVEQDPAGWDVCQDYSQAYEALSGIWEAQQAPEAAADDPSAPEAQGDAGMTVRSHGDGTGSRTADVAEGDIIRWDGKYIYILSGSRLTVLLAEGTGAAWVSETQVGMDWEETDSGAEDAWGGSEKRPVSLYLFGSKLAVVSDWYGYDGYMENGQSVCDYTEYTCVDIYDISNPGVPLKTASFRQDGYESSGYLRDGVLYQLSSYWVYGDSADEEPSAYIPSLGTEEETALIEAEDICLSQNAAANCYTLVCAYDLAAEARTGELALLGVDGPAYMGEENLYLLGSRYARSVSRTMEAEGYNITEWAEAACTDIFRVSLSQAGVAISGSGTVPGQVGSAYDLEEWEGQLRCSTALENIRYTVSEDAAPESETREYSLRETARGVYALDKDLKVTGALTALPEDAAVAAVWIAGDRIYALDNTGRAYAVSFDGGAPTADALETDVFPEAVFPWGEQAVAGLSRDETGRLRLSVFSLGEDGFQETAGLSLGGDYRAALDSERTLFFSGEAGILVLPSADSVSVFQYTGEQDMACRTEVFPNDWVWNVRCFLTEDMLYLVNTEEVQTYSLADFSVLNSLSF